LISLSCFTANPPLRTGTAKKLSARPRHSLLLAILFVTLVSLHGGPAAAQQTTAEPAAGPLPTVTYPARDPDTAPPPAASVPQPEPTVIVVVPDRYYLVGGVWGYWDRERRFHRASLDGRRVISRRQPLPQYAIHLSNFPSGSILARPLASRERGVVR
jgi:hypothetical protein